jgi:ferredoxin
MLSSVKLCVRELFYSLCVRATERFCSAQLLVSGFANATTCTAQTSTDNEHFVHVQSCRAHTVEFRRLDGTSSTLQLEEGEVILEAMLDAGLDPSHDCKMGVCMTCPARVVRYKSPKPLHVPVFLLPHSRYLLKLQRVRSLHYLLVQALWIVLIFRNLVTQHCVLPLCISEDAPDNGLGMCRRQERWTRGRPCCLRMCGARGMRCCACPLLFLTLSSKKFPKQRFLMNSSVHSRMMCRCASPHLRSSHPMATCRLPWKVLKEVLCSSCVTTHSDPLPAADRVKHISALNVCGLCLIMNVVTMLQTHHRHVNCGGIKMMLLLQSARGGEIPGF